MATDPAGGSGWYKPVASFMTGMVSAQVAALFTNPIDVVKVGASL